MKRILSFLCWFALLAAAVGLGFAFRDPLEHVVAQLETKFIPCTRPITYSIGAFDARFGISQDDFQNALAEAGRVWDTPIDKTLFQEQPSGGELAVNLVYDERQSSTDKLKKLGLVVKDNQASYDTLKARLNFMKSDETVRKSSLDDKVGTFQTRQNAYEQEVASWNTRGGAPKPEYDRLNVEKAALDQEYQAIQRDEATLSGEIDSINALVVVVNRLAASLNLNVDQYNKIGGSNGSEFTEGNEQDGPDGQIINIYQFDDRQKLVRLLAHELGHALGLAHVEDPKAIMYRLNQGTNITPTAADLSELKQQCRIK